MCLNCFDYLPGTVFLWLLLRKGFRHELLHSSSVGWAANKTPSTRRFWANSFWPTCEPKIQAKESFENGLFYHKSIQNCFPISQKKDANSKKKSARLAFWNVLSRLLAGCMFPWQFSGARFPPNIFVHDLFGAYRSEVMLFIYIIYSISFMHFSMLVSTRKFD